MGGLTKGSKGYMDRHHGGMAKSGITRLVMLAIFSGMLFGVDLGCIGGGIGGMTADLDLTSLQVEAIVSGCKGGAVVGCFLGGAWMAVYGRKSAIVMAILPFLAGPILTGLSAKFWEALIGRLLAGFSVGAASVVVPCYLSEAAMPDVRGAIVATYEVAIAFGFLISSVMSYTCEVAAGAEMKNNTWRLQVGVVPAAAALPLALVLFFIPESPRWLLSKTNCDSQVLLKTLYAMRKLGVKGTQERLKMFQESKGGSGSTSGDESVGLGPTNDLIAIWDMKHRMLSQSHVDREDGLTTESEVSDDRENSLVKVISSTFLDLAKILVGSAGVPPGIRKGLCLALIAAILDQANASTSILVYAQHILQSVGVTSREMQDKLAIIVAGCKFLGVFVGMFMIDRMGRRHLLGVGGALSTLFLVGVTVGAALRSPPILIFSMSAFILCFVATWGNGYWVVVTEVTAGGGRQFGSAAQAAATGALFWAGWLTSFTFVSVMEVGYQGLLLYAFVSFLMIPYAYCLLPETKGLTLEECAMKVAGSKHAMTMIGEIDAGEDLKTTSFTSSSEDENEAVSHDVSTQ